ncbi:MAG: glutathione S-transferase, partial [Aestuariivirgaceae bacterium]
MAEFQLYCFGESGNAYKAALMLALTGLDWEPVFVDFFNGETRSATYREKINKLGEAPVLEHGSTRLSQSGVILDYLVEQSGQFGPKDARHRRDIWRWILFDNHKFTSYLATLRFLTRFVDGSEPAVLGFLTARAQTALGIVDKHLSVQSFVT